jgi:hypothetical protein
LDSPQRQLNRSAAKLTSIKAMILRSGESQLEAHGLAEKLKELWDEEFQGPFPYDDCRWLKREFDAELDHLISDLDLWVIDVIGFASQGRTLLEFSREQALRARGLASLSFYEQHPEYAWFERHVSESNTLTGVTLESLSNKSGFLQSMKSLLIRTSMATLISLFWLTTLVHTPY